MSRQWSLGTRGHYILPIVDISNYKYGQSAIKTPCKNGITEVYATPGESLSKTKFHYALSVQKILV